MGANDLGARRPGNHPHVNDGSIGVVCDPDFCHGSMLPLHRQPMVYTFVGNDRDATTRPSDGSEPVIVQDRRPTVWDITLELREESHQVVEPAGLSTVKEQRAGVRPMDTKPGGTAGLPSWH